MLYRFSKPTDARFPAMLEIFSRLPDSISLADDQTIVPIPAGEESHSLSAILVDDDYHGLIPKQREIRDGVGFANASALIPLKEAGKNIDNKRRANVFRLGATLPGDATVELPESIRADLSAFLAAFPEDSTEWPAILSAIKNTVGGSLRSAALRHPDLLPSIMTAS